MRYLILVGLLLLCPFISMAQIQNVTDFAGKPLRISKSDKVEGSEYLTDWIFGLVVAADNQREKTMEVRYNAYKDEMEFKKNQEPYIFNEGEISKVEFIKPNKYGENEKYEFRYYPNSFEGLQRVNYIRVLYDGADFKILEKIEIIKSKVTSAAYGEGDYERFSEKSDTYFVINNKAIKSTLNKKGFYNAFPKIKSEIKDYIRNNDVDFNSTADIKKLSEFISGKKH